MATKEATIKAILTASASWTTLVTGGVFTFDELGRTGLTPESADANGCYDANGKLELTAVLTFGASNEAEVLKSEGRFMRLWLYHDSSYATIRQAQRVAKDLLDGTVSAKTTDEGTILLRWVDDMADFVEDELGGAMASCSRYRLMYRRQ